MKGIATTGMLLACLVTSSVFSDEERPAVEGTEWPVAVVARTKVRPLARDLQNTTADMVFGPSEDAGLADGEFAITVEIGEKTLAITGDYHTTPNGKIHLQLDKPDLEDMLPEVLEAMAVSNEAGLDISTFHVDRTKLLVQVKERRDGSIKVRLVFKARYHGRWGVDGETRNRRGTLKLRGKEIFEP